MGTPPTLAKQSCCLAVMPDLSTARLARLGLHQGRARDLDISVLSKPEIDPGCGAITCRGPLRKHLPAQINGLWQVDEVLNFIGVPLHHREIYDRALETGLAVLVLQGDSKALRQGCQNLEDISLGKPVLYLV